MLQRILVSVLLALTCYTASSKADIVSVPILNGQISVNVMTGADAYQLQQIKNNPAATLHYIGDDGNVNVPLGFTFPYFGKGFTNSWMYSNGAVSFVSGNAPGGFCCSGINLTTTRDTGYNYSLLPLQTDLIGTTNNNFYTLGNNTSMTYGWYGINEYGTENKSSFEVKIDNTGLVDFRFGQAFITSHPVTIGLTGDLSKGEYYQHYTGNGINQSSFGFNGNFSAGYDVCSADPLSSTTCSGYAAAYLTYQCSISALYDSSCPGYATAYFNQQCSISALYDASCPGYATAYFNQQCTANQLYNTSCPGYAAAYLTQQCNITQLYSTSCPGYNTAFAQKIALQAQVKLSTTDTSSSTTSTDTSSSSSGSTSSSTNSGSTTVAVGGTVTDSTSTNAEVKLDLGGATVSTSGEIRPADNIPDVARTVTATSTTTGETLTANAQEKKSSNVNALSIARNAVAATEAIARSVANDSAKMSYSQNANPSDGIGLSLEMTGVKLNIPGLSFGTQSFGGQQETTIAAPTFYNSNTSTAMLNIDTIQEQKFIPKQENSNSGTNIDAPAIPQQANSGHFENNSSSITAMQEQRIDNNETVKNKGGVSELAGGVDLNQLTLVPAGYGAYMAVSIKDSPFYDVKEVYKNQKTIDNARALRSLSSDRLHQEMVNRQYKIGN